MTAVGRDTAPGTRCSAAGAGGAPHIVVAGGGLAGVAAAIALCDGGVRVTLAEARPRLGGATCSFTRDGRTVDNGQHIFLRCCTAYRGLLDRLGGTAKTVLQDRFDVRVLTPSGAARLRRRGLPAPLHLASALATYPLLSPRERAGAVRAALAFRRVDPADPAVDKQRLGDWLGAHGQGPHARRALWDLFVVSAMNIAGDDASLALAAMVIKTALLGEPGAADIGVPVVPLGELHGQAADAVLRRLGATVLTGSKVTAVSRVAAGPDGSGGFTVTLGGAAPGRDLAADGVVLAVPPAQAANLLPAPAAGPPGTAGDPAGWPGLGESPIVNVHVVYDRPVTGLPFAAAVGSPVQWIFDRTGISGCDGGQYLALSLSAADEYAGQRTGQLRTTFLPALEQLLPAARAAHVTDFFVTREPRATFRQVPGTAALRPGAATRLGGLALAGAWTDTGWPDTMEGAVRSGLEAARTILASLGVRR
ncbi:MAG TPA: hydroxysqualene dehydroxylase HpnE [Streptosporangiaceae bacterium]|nr:hydroxysqualene dehydroxylase HpnE [Streptosporangiaceae bacterium]